MSPAEICTLLDFCRNCTYFVFDRLPVSMIVCYMQMEDLEELAIATAPTHPQCTTTLDDTHSKLDAGYGQAFTDHLNILDLDLQFTTEEEDDNGALVFLDTITQ